MVDRGKSKFKILSAFNEPEARDLLSREISAHDDIQLRQLLTLESIPKALRQEEFDLILMDVDYPDSDIYHIVQEIQELNSHQAFIIVTSNNSYEMIIFSMESGALDILRKPLDEIAVGKILRNHRRRIIESLNNLNLNQFVTYKKARIVLPMDINILPQVANKITSEIYNAGVIEPSRIYTLNLAVFECLTNAMEHGNLEIGYDGKTEFIKSGDYLGELKKLSRNGPYREKRIIVSYEIDEEGVTIEIEDEGKGFDVNTYLERIKTRSEEDYHGRGLILAMKMVDGVEFNEKGNVIRLKLKRAERGRP